MSVIQHRISSHVIFLSQQLRSLLGFIPRDSVKRTRLLFLYNYSYLSVVIGVLILALSQISIGEAVHRGCVTDDQRDLGRLWHPGKRHTLQGFDTTYVMPADATSPLTRPLERTGAF